MGKATDNPQYRNAMFAQMTRQNKQMLPKEKFSAGARTLEFSLPKARLLSKIMFDVTCNFKLTHATKTTFDSDEFTPYNLIRRVSLDLNNGFSPYSIGGAELAIYNAIRMNCKHVFPQNTNPDGYCYLKTMVASTVGALNEMRFTVELPVTLNDRDPIGLILLQNAETNVTLSIDLASDNDIVRNEDGYTVQITDGSIQPMVETFSLPAVQEAYPDISVLKLVNSRSEGFQGTGQNVIKLTTGTIYRKLAFRIVDENGVPFADDDITSNIDLIFNQADINYSMSAQALRHENILQFGGELPKGVYVFDFSYNGFSNYGGTRDYIDTELLSEFWLRFSSNKKGKISIVTEQISRLK